MARFSALAALALVLALAACEQPDPNGPVATVQKLYAPYTAQGGDTAAALTNAPMTESLRAVVDKGITYGNLLDEPVLDFDPIINAQEAKISQVNVTRQSLQGDTALVMASFQNFDRKDQVAYELKRIDGAWKIENIRPGVDDLRKIIETNLKPLGDPAAMTAPVKAIYDAYGLAPKAEPVGPLQKWAPVSAAFGPLLQRRQDKIAAGEADPLGFDPVIDGTDWQISDLKLEAASSAVIARFTNGPAAKVIVYDLIEENGAWKIDNIRAPGVWNVRLKLLDAGIQ
jgi:hypothetical protein